MKAKFALAAHVGADGSWEIIPSTQDGNTINVTTASFSVVGIVISDGLRAVGDFLAAAFAGRTEPPTCDAPPAWASVSPVSTGAVHVCARTNPDANVRAEIEVKSNRGTFQWVEIPQVPTPAFVWVEDQPDWLRATVGRIFGRNPASSVLLAPGKRLTIGYTQPVADASIAVRAYPELDTYTLSTLWQIAQYLGVDSTSLNLVLGLYCFGVLDLDPNVVGSAVHVPKLSAKTAGCLVDTIADLGKDEATAKKTAEKILGPGASADEMSKVAPKVKAVGQAAVILKLGSFIAVKLTEVADAHVAAFTPEANSEAVITLKGQPPEAPKTAKCEDVGGEAASDDVATNVVATGLACTEARALVTKAMDEHNFYSGPRTFKMNGFDCSVVTSEEGMPSGKYTCVSGGKRVTWTKF